MTLTRKFILAAALAGVLAAPLSALAISPIGGRITGMIPCKFGGYTVTVLGFGIGTGAFWYLPGASIAYLYGPPYEGEWILGLSDVPTTCGERITYSGTSPI